MKAASDLQARDSVRSTLQSLWLVVGFAVATGALRFAIWSANWITLGYVYGWAAVRREHLRIVRVKPELVVSNGDVLKGIGFSHYLVSVVIWLPLAFGLLALIFYKLVPRQLQAVLREPRKRQEPQRVGRADRAAARFPGDCQIGFRCGDDIGGSRRFGTFSMDEKISIRQDPRIE